MSTVNGLFTELAKNSILNGWSSQSLLVFATNATGTTRSDSQSISFSSASGAEINLSSTVSLTITSGSNNSNAIKKIVVSQDIVGPPVDQIVFEIASAIDFPDGGSLVINSLKVSLDDPS